MEEISLGPKNDGTQKEMKHFGAIIRHGEPMMDFNSHNYIRYKFLYPNKCD